MNQTQIWPYILLGLALIILWLWILYRMTKCDSRLETEEERDNREADRRWALIGRKRPEL